MTYIVMVRWRAKSGKEVRIAELLQPLSEASRAEPGCLQFSALRAADDGRTFLLFEVYEDEAAFKRHQQTGHYRRYVLNEAIELLEERVRRDYVEL